MLFMIYLANLAESLARADADICSGDYKDVITHCNDALVKGEVD
jgi:hypothetical protein